MKMLDIRRIETNNEENKEKKKVNFPMQQQVQRVPKEI